MQALFVFSVIGGMAFSWAVALAEEPTEIIFDGRPDLSPDGKQIAYISYPNVMEKRAQLYIAQSDGTRVRPLTSNFDYVKGPDWSPNGSQIVFGGQINGSYDVYVVNPDGSGLKQLTDFSYDAYEPVFSPDGNKILYNALPGEYFQMHILDMETGENSVFLDPDYHVVAPDWSANGKIVFSSEKNGLNDIFIINEDGSGLKQVTFHPGAETGPAWSPDGTKIAFHSNWSHPELKWGGMWDIYILDPETSELAQVTSDPKQELFPNWGPDNGTLIYSWHDNLFGIVYIANKDPVTGAWQSSEIKLKK